jgi:hypothetical protein
MRRPGPALSRAALAAALVLALPSGAAAAGLADQSDQWQPSAPDASWTYSWSDSAYAPTPTREQVTVVSNTGPAFRLAWTTAGQDNAEGAVDSNGVVDYTRTDAGLLNTSWSSSPPPPQFPILCANESGCGNSLASTEFLLIWGARSPLLAEPLLQGTRWSSVGGAANDVASENRYLGMQKVIVPAFPRGIYAAKVQSDITQAGAIGDPYGSGIRTVWWARGIGPVKIFFRHTGGQIGQATLLATNQTARPAPSDVNYLPLIKGQTATFGYRNSKYLPKRSTQKVTVAQVVNSTARLDVKSVSGPIRVASSYVFSSRLAGVTNVTGATRAQTRAPFPKLGPATAPADKRRHLFTPVDLMVYGFNPVLRAYPAKGQVWKSSKVGRDYKVFGVTGRSVVLGRQTVRTPAGRFRALAVRSTLTQKGFRYGSGTRTSWFAPGKGLVKLVFRHRDGSVSTVERLK